MVVVHRQTPLHWWTVDFSRLWCAEGMTVNVHSLMLPLPMTCMVFLNIFHCCGSCLSQHYGSALWMCVWWHCSCPCEKFIKLSFVVLSGVSCQCLIGSWLHRKLGREWDQSWFPTWNSINIPTPVEQGTMKVPACFIAFINSILKNFFVKFPNHWSLWWW